MVSRFLGARSCLINPALHALFALLNNREVECAIGLEFIGQIADEHELVIVLVLQGAASPHHFLNTGTDLGTPTGVGLLVVTFYCFQGPASFGLWFDADHAFRNTDTDFGGGRAFATMRYGQHSLVAAA